MIRGLLHIVDSYLTQKSQISQKYSLPSNILCFQWFLCAFIRTNLCVIRPECDAETHSDFPSTH